MHLPMHKHTTSSVILVQYLLPTFERDIFVGVTNGIQAIVNKTVSFGKPDEEVLVVGVIHRNV